MPQAVYASSGSASRAAAARSLRVLVLDDELDTVTTLLALLLDEGYIAEGFASGRAALYALHKFDPDVVISDIAMPYPNGWDVGRGVRLRMGDKRPMLIAISGQYAKAADMVLAQINGFNHCLTKPCDPTVLLALIAPLASKLRHPDGSQSLVA